MNKNFRTKGNNLYNPPPDIATANIAIQMSNPNNLFWYSSVWHFYGIAHIGGLPSKERS